ncbi:MAG: cytochrome c oxidase subunit II [Gammaproteobacteria bacterium]|nr:cytochrome c oxidase subunit II [Gammaproteobacteria bacterium]
MFVKKLRNYIVCAAVSLSALWSTSASAEYALNLTKGVTPISREVYDLHMIILYVVTAIGVAVFAVMFWSILHHRKSKGAVAAQFHHSTVAELTWTIIPVLILVVMAIPATKTLIKMEETTSPDMTIKVTGYQWKWKYDYMDEDISFFSSLNEESNKIRKGESETNVMDHENYLLDVDNHVVVPVKKKIRILTTAADVIHAWWVPALGWKRDAIPGFINDNWTYIEEPGIYRGQCAELCGRDHGFMPIVVEAVTEPEYLAWVEKMKTQPVEINPEKLYATHCSTCHQANGQGLPGAFPALAGSPIAIGPAAAHIDIVLNGKPGTAMLAYGPQLSNEELAAIITYERNAWGNDVGDVVTPEDVQAAR